MASEYTPNRRYPLYTDTDKPNLRDQYNGAIREIDTDMVTALDNAQDVADGMGAGFDAQHTVRMAIESMESAVEEVEASLSTKASSSSVTAISEKLPSSSFSSTNTVKKYVDTQISAIDDAKADSSDLSALAAKLPTGSFTSTNTVKKYIDDGLSGKASSSDLSALAAKLPTGSFSSTNTVKKYIDDALQNVHLNMKERKIVCFGDSLTKAGHADTYWPSFLSTKTGCQTWNKGVNGSGFTRPSTFLAAIQNAVADSSIPHGDITDVILLGGINDWEADTGTLQSALTQCVTALRSGFPNADIHFGPMIKGPKPLRSIHARSRLQAAYLSNTAMSNNIHLLPQPWAWLMRPSIASSTEDSLHVNNSGQAYLAGSIAACLTGTGSPFPNQAGTMTLLNSSTVQSWFNTSSTEVSYNQVGPINIIHGHLTFTSDTEVTLPLNQEQIIALPVACCTSIGGASPVEIAPISAFALDVASNSVIMPGMVLDQDKLLIRGCRSIHRTTSLHASFEFVYELGV